jgi:transposase
VYGSVQKLLVAQEFGNQRKKHRGAIRAYVEKVAGLSTPQVTRLIRQYKQTGSVAVWPCLRRRFPRKYTAQDIALLAEVDRAHERLSGPATRCILKREYEQFDKREHVRLAEISIAHLYNLRNSARYRKQAAVFEPTRPSAVSIGERRKPDPQGRPGFCAWIPCIKETGTAPRACTTSTRSIR